MGNDNDWSGGIGNILRNLFGNNQQQQIPDIGRQTNMNGLLPENSLLDGAAVAGANQAAGAGGAAGGYQPGFLEGMTGYTDAEGIQHNGWGGLALGAGQGIMGGWMGMQQLNQAKDQLGESKRQFNKNFEANRSTTNTRLEDRQKARVASNAGAYESVGNYMNKNKV